MFVIVAVVVGIVCPKHAIRIRIRIRIGIWEQHSAKVTATQKIALD